MSSEYLSIICIIIVLNFVYALGTQVFMDENYTNATFYQGLWVATIIGLIINYFISVDI